MLIILTVLSILVLTVNSQKADLVINGREDCKKKVGLEGWFTCKDNRNRCVHEDAICDGVADCYDASDEVASGWAPQNQCNSLTISKYKCPENYIKCHTLQGAGCLSDLWKCDGTQHCQDDSDEQDCPNVNFQLSSSTVLGVFIFALLIFTVTLCIAVLGVYATNKARSRRRAANRQAEQRSRLREVFSVLGDDGLDNPTFAVDRNSSAVMAPPPYALVEEQRIARMLGSETDAVEASSSASPNSTKPPSYEDIFGVISDPRGVTDPSSLPRGDADPSHVPRGVALPSPIPSYVSSLPRIPREATVSTSVYSAETDSSFVPRNETALSLVPSNETSSSLVPSDATESPSVPNGRSSLTNGATDNRIEATNESSLSLDNEAQNQSSA